MEQVIEELIEANRANAEFFALLNQVQKEELKIKEVFTNE